MNPVNLIVLVACVAFAAANTESDDVFGFETSAENRVETRIVGGENATEGQFPYQISLRNTLNRQHFCGGSILSVSKKILFAQKYCFL